MASSTASSSLSVTLSHAIAYLTRSFDGRFDLIAVSKLRVVLEAELSNAFASSWDPSNPIRGSGLRCLTLAPNATPPRPIHTACLASGIKWADWAATLGGLEFDMFIDPGCVSVRVGMERSFTVWSAGTTSSQQSFRAPTSAPASRSASFGPSRSMTAPRNMLSAPPLYSSPSWSSTKTVAQQLCEEDDHDDLFSMIANEVATPAWMAPILEKFPTVPAGAGSRLSMPPMHSRSSSVCSTSSSSDYSFSSSEGSSSYGSRSSTSTHSSSPTSPQKQQYRSRRTRQRESQVFVDTTKKAVTPYDGGKTTVLGGGVMLGAPSVNHRRTQSTMSGTYRLPTL